MIPSIEITKALEAGSAVSSNWKTYRQELRDLTSGLDTVDKVNNVTWPTKPS